MKNEICPVCGKICLTKPSLRRHLLKRENKKHLDFCIKQEKLALKILKKNGLIFNIEKFILGGKEISRIWRSNFNEEEIKKNRYKKKKFKCSECGNDFIQRQSTTGICCNCLKLRRKKCKCKSCKKIIGENKTGLCKNCLNHTEEGKKILTEINKGKNLNNPGWARVKKKNNFIEERTKNVLISVFKLECQKRILNFRVDIFLKDYKIIVECDGRQHYEIKKQFERDKSRDAILNKEGYRIIRFNSYFIQKLSGKILIKVKKFINLKKKREFNYCDKFGKVMRV